MNEDRIAGAGKEMLGKGERKIGSVVGSDRVTSDGVADQVSGAIQHGYGELKDGIAAAVGGAPAILDDALDQGRRLARRTDDAVRDVFGDPRPIYALAGAIAVLAIALLYAGRDR